jgi:succinate dehydrogenase cytochrome b subunit
MNLLGSLFHTSIGKKILMAFTGLVLFGFVTGHLLGNLQIFLPPEKINAYGHMLESLGALLWLIRIFLLVCLIIHVWLGIQLALENRAARPTGYSATYTIRATLASRVMARTGIVVLAFLIYHLMDFSFRVQHPEWSNPTYQLGNGEWVRDLHTMMVHGFSRMSVSIFYILAVGLLSYHLSHGTVSLVQTFGFKNEKWTRGLERFTVTYCWIYFLLNASIPLAILSGLVKARV